jgi:predicted restriction endonuclease
MAGFGQLIDILKKDPKKIVPEGLRSYHSEKDDPKAYFELKELIEKDEFWTKENSIKKLFAEDKVMLSQLSLFEQAIGNNNEKEIEKEIEKDIEQLEGRDKETIIKSRVNQSVFRNKLLEKYTNCCLCKVNDSNFLRASHIKPWSKSNSIEKLDVNNGLLLCPNHDALFDIGVISFNDDGNILISEKLTDVNKLMLNINPNMKIEVTTSNLEYIRYHRENIYKG